MKLPLPAVLARVSSRDGDGYRGGLARASSLLPIAGAAWLALLAYAAVVEPRRLRAVAYTLLVPDLPPSLVGLRLAHLTDFHVGMRGTPPTVLRRAVSQALAWRPDLALLTGDFVHNSRWLAEADLFRGLAETIPTFAVLGNHDSLGARHETEQIVAALEDSGVRVLRNRSTTVEFGDRGEVVLVGVDDPSLRRDDLAQAMDGLPTERDQTRPTILLAHAPEIADRAPERRFALIVCGHTHGGQLRLSPVQHRTILDFGMMAGGLVSPYARGAWLVRGNPLFVNSGLGLSGLPFRFLSPPEVALFTLAALPDGIDPAANPFILDETPGAAADRRES